MWGFAPHPTLKTTFLEDFFRVHPPHPGLHPAWGRSTHRPCSIRCCSSSVLWSPRRCSGRYAGCLPHRVRQAAPPVHRDPYPSGAWDQSSSSSNASCVRRSMSRSPAKICVFLPSASGMIENVLEMPSCAWRKGSLATEESDATAP